MLGKGQLLAQHTKLCHTAVNIDKKVILYNGVMN